MEFNFNIETFARLIDISGVRANITLDEVRHIATAAKKYRFISAFVMPCFTGDLLELLKNEQDILVGGVVGFPSGSNTTSIKVLETLELVSLGIKEVDMVINIGALKSGLFRKVEHDIAEVVKAANGLPVKSIIEVAYLTEDEIGWACQCAIRAGAHYVKTGTGWANQPTTLEHIKLIKRLVGNEVKIKAAGGIGNVSTIQSMVKAGCDRFGIGLNSALKIMKEFEELATEL